MTEPGTIVSPESDTAVAEFLAENANGARQQVTISGGDPSINGEGIGLSTKQLNRIVDFPARDMTVTVEAGVTIAELAKTVAAEQQQLPIDVANPCTATIGGIVAANVNGPRRFGYGTLRDYVIGISAVDGQGRLFSAGGRVVKNVAGYDLCKLLNGSYGSLAAITQVTLRLKPLPAETGALWATYANRVAVERVLERLNTSEARPVPLDLMNSPIASRVAKAAELDLCADGLTLVISVEGSREEVDWQLNYLTRETTAFDPDEFVPVGNAEQQQLLAAMTSIPVCHEEPIIGFHGATLPSRIPPLVEWASENDVAIVTRAGNGTFLANAGGAEQTASQLGGLVSDCRRQVEADGGFVEVCACPEKWADIARFGKPRGEWQLMQRVKSSLDPHHLFNNGPLDGILRAETSS